MKWFLAFGITLLLFPIPLLPQNEDTHQPVIRSVTIRPGYRLASDNKALLNVRPEADLSHHYRITDYGYMAAGIELQPVKPLTVSLGACLSNFKATDQYLIGLMEPLNYEVPFDQLSFSGTIAWQVTPGWKIALSGQTLSGVQPLMVWEEQELGGEYVQAPHFYRDWMIHGLTSGKWGRFEVGLSGGYNYLHANSAFQGGLSLKALLFPKETTQLGVSAYVVMDTLNPEGRFIFQASAAQKLIGSLWAQANYSYGIIQNMAWEGGGEPYNLFDPVRQQLDIALHVKRLTRNLGLTLQYAWSQRTANWELYTYGEPAGTEHRDYSFHSFTGTIIWYF